MSEPKIANLSRDDHEAVQKAREQIAQAQRRIEELISRHLGLTTDTEANDIKFTKLSRDDYDEVKKARQQIVDAERRIANLILNKLNITHENPSIQRIPLRADGGGQPRTLSQELRFEVIYCGCCDPCGVYVDPPGICAEI